MKTDFVVIINFIKYSDGNILLAEYRAENKINVYKCETTFTYILMSGIRQRDSVMVCLNAAKPIELWWSVGWVHLSDSASWQNGFRQLSCTAGKSDLICSDRWTQNCTSAWVTLHSTTATPETAGASLKPRSNRNHLMRAGVYLCLLNFKSTIIIIHKFHMSRYAFRYMKNKLKNILLTTYVRITAAAAKKKQPMYLPVILLMCANPFEYQIRLKKSIPKLQW